MDDLVTWLRQQLDEDERVARATVPGPWWVGVNGLDVHSEGLYVMENFDDPGPWLRALPEYMVRWDPARVLREVEAKRQIIELAEYLLSLDREDGDLGRQPLLATGGREILRFLAVAYSDRPGYREEWRP